MFLFTKNTINAINHRNNHHHIITNIHRSLRVFRDFSQKTKQNEKYSKLFPSFSFESFHISFKHIIQLLSLTQLCFDAVVVTNSTLKRQNQEQKNVLKQLNFAQPIVIGTSDLKEWAIFTFLKYVLWKN